MVEQAMVLADGDVLHPEDLPQVLNREAQTPARAEAEDSPLSLSELKRQHVLSVLQQCGGNRVRAAGVLQISERNLRRMLKRYESSPAETDAASEGDTDT